MLTDKEKEEIWNIIRVEFVGMRTDDIIKNLLIRVEYLECQVESLKDQLHDHKRDHGNQYYGST